MKTIPPSAPIMQLITPGVHLAVNDAVQRSHDRDPLDHHRRYGTKIDAKCHLCPTPEQELLEADRQRILNEQLDEQLPPGAVLAPWQRKLATEVLEAKSAELDAVVDEAVPSPALQAYLAEHELVPDQPEPEADADLARMTTKELRPLASAAGMKGARVAKKAEMIEFLTGN